MPLVFCNTLCRRKEVCTLPDPKKVFHEDVAALGALPPDIEWPS